MIADFKGFARLLKRADLIAIREALDSGVSPELKNEHGYNLLMLAASIGSVAVGELLIAKGADPNTPGPGYSTAAVFAATNGHTRFLEMLLRHGADPAPNGQPVSQWLQWCRLDEKKKAEIARLLESSLADRAG